MQEYPGQTGGADKLECRQFGDRIFESPTEKVLQHVLTGPVSAKSAIPPTDHGSRLRGYVGVRNLGLTEGETETREGTSCVVDSLAR